VVLDPDLIIPRVDQTVKEALHLLEIASRAGALTRAGLDAETSGNFDAAMENYDAAIAADPGSILPRFRRARVQAAVEHYEAALAAHRETAEAAERRAKEMALLASTVDPEAGAAEAPPGLWLRAEDDFRSWNQVRMGQVEDFLGKRSAAKRAYRRALDLPDLRGAHDEAMRCLASPCRSAKPQLQPQAAP
jgi:tetratricopeptide (TPR) repeat protein